MKWFKHFTKAHEDRAVETLISEYGVSGYGLYFYCLEIIAGSIDAENISFELEPDAKILARRLSMDTILVEKIMHSCVDLGLFEITDNGRLSCLKMAKYLEKSSTSNKEMRKIIGESRKIIGKSGLVRISQDVPDQIRLDEIRLDEKKEKKEKTREREESPSLENSLNPNSSSFNHFIGEIQTTWSVEEVIPKFTFKLDVNLTDKERQIFKIAYAIHPIDKIVKAIENYAKILKGNGKEYDIMPYGSLITFLEKGVDQYCDDSKPFDRHKAKAVKKDFDYLEYKAERDRKAEEEADAG
jgi:predicted DNA binding protein